MFASSALEEPARDARGDASRSRWGECAAYVASHRGCQIERTHPVSGGSVRYLRALHELVEIIESKVR